MKKTIKINKIVTTEVQWLGLTILQPESLKELNNTDYQALKRSILDQGYIDPVKVWYDEASKQTYILDGVHRIMVMKKMKEEGYKLPDTVPATFIQCKDRQQAMNLILIYSSQYAKITSKGLYDFITIENIELPDIAQNISLPTIDLENFALIHFPVEKNFQDNIAKQTIKKLEEKIKEDKLYQLSFAFDKTNRDWIMKAIEIAGKKYNTDNSNSALVHICKSFINKNE